MIYNIENKALQVILKDEFVQLPNELRKEINKNFEKIKSTGANVWNGEVLCVQECNAEEDRVEIVCKKSDYAHYLYGERCGCPKEYECKNLSAGCLIETIDGYFIVGELDETTSYPTMLQVTGGGIDKADFVDGKINVEQTIIREAKEELNIDLNDTDNVLYNKISYIYVSEEDEQPGVQLFSKAKIKMTANEMKNYFEKYYKYLNENNLEIEFKTLYFIKKEQIEENLKKMLNPKRNYLLPLLLEAVR